MPKQLRTALSFEFWKLRWRFFELRLRDLNQPIRTLRCMRHTAGFFVRARRWEVRCDRTWNRWPQRTRKHESSKAFQNEPEEPVIFATDLVSVVSRFPHYAIFQGDSVELKRGNVQGRLKSVRLKAFSLAVVVVAESG